MLISYIGLGLASSWSRWSGRFGDVRFAGVGDLLPSRRPSSHQPCLSTDCAEMCRVKAPQRLWTTNGQGPSSAPITNHCQSLPISSNLLYQLYLDTCIENLTWPGCCWMTTQGSYLGGLSVERTETHTHTCSETYNLLQPQPKDIRKLVLLQWGSVSDCLRTSFATLGGR